MMSLVVDKLVEVLSASPDPVLTASNIGVKSPSNGSDIPAIAVSLTIEHDKGTGIGRFVRSGESIAKNTAVIEVRATPETFSSDLRLLRLWPLPLVKNPSSTKRNFSEEDIQIRNVTDLGHPIDYRIVEKPVRKEEYTLDVPRAQVVFGGPQTEAEKLEVSHWTVTWKDDVLNESYTGSMTLDIWSNNLNQGSEIARKLQQKLSSNRALLRQKGFLKLQPAGLEAVENIQHGAAIGSPFTAWKQKLTYKFAFEAQEGGELSSGIPIKRIDVDMDDHIDESLSIP